MLFSALCIAENPMAREAADRALRATGTNAAYTPAHCAAIHNVGALTMTVGTRGGLGSNYARASTDCFTGATLVSCEYPTGSATTYLYGGALWIGAVVGQSDTLVSTASDGWWALGYEWNPNEAPMGLMKFRSTIDPSAYEYAAARSEQDFIGSYTDTCLDCIGAYPDEVDGRPHRPLYLQITQSSYAWSEHEFEDFILIDYRIENIGSQRLTDIYAGFYVDGDVGATAYLSGNAMYTDDVAGFRSHLANTLIPGECGAESTLVNLAYISDNDGDLSHPVPIKVPAVTGISFLRTPWDSGVSFNWWVSNSDASRDYGPMTRSQARDFGTGGTGTPVGDRNKYYMLRNGETDFDQVFTGQIGTEHPVWLPPNPSTAAGVADGYDARYLLSGGPFSLASGESRSLTIAYVAGADFHSDSTNIGNLPEHPQAYSANLSFDDLATNVHWARRVHDTPGFDSDGDGYAGEFIVCAEDTVWTAGDGAPDFQAAVPPPAPVVRVQQQFESILIQWNDFRCQRFVEPLTRRHDFEGCAVYLAVRHEFESPDWVRVASWDVEDFHKYVWDSAAHGWQLEKRRFMLDELLCLYAPKGCQDGEWQPLQCPRQRPYIMSGHPDSVFYFQQIGTNTVDFGRETPIRKRFPGSKPPTWADPTEVPQDSVDMYLTEDGYFIYHEFELRLTDVIPGTEYYLAVTAFDHGAYAAGARFLESPKFRDSVLVSPVCCDSLVAPGNVNADCHGIVDMADFLDLVDCMFVTFDCDLCLVAADLDCSAEGTPGLADISLSDLTLLIDYLFITHAPLVRCQ